jgi:hypothetical protein
LVYICISIYIYIMSGSGSWLQFANRANKFKGSYFQDFADISGDVIVRNTGNVFLHAGSNMYMTAGDISMNGFIYCRGVVDLSGNSLATGDSSGNGTGLTSLSTVDVKSIHTSDFVTTNGYATIGNYLNVTGSTTLNGILTSNGNSVFNGQLDGSGASFNTLSVGNTELKGSIIPDTNSAYDIGSITNKIRDLYVSESSIWIGDNNKLSVENNKITMKQRKQGDNDIPKFIRDKIAFESLTDKVTHVQTFASNNLIGKSLSDELSTYTVTDWLNFANKKGELVEDGFVKTNHTASDIYDVANDFDEGDTGQWNTVSTGIINYSGKITVGTDANTHALETLGKTTLLGKVAVGGYSNSNYQLYVNGSANVGSTLKVDGNTFLTTTNVGNNLNVTQNANITGNLGVGKSADSTHNLDVLGKSRVSDDAYFNKSLLIGVGVNTTTLTNNNASGTALYIETPLTSGSYPDISHNVVINVPNTVFKAKDNDIITNTNSLEIDATNRSILPYVRDINGDLVNNGMTNGWSLGGPGPNRFDNIHARDINISTETINIEDASGNKIGMSFDATTGSVNYTVVTKDTADASGETFVIKGVQTQKISSGTGKIDPSLLEFTGLSYGGAFDSSLNYDLTTAYSYDLTTTTYTGDGIDVFTDSAGAQGLSSFVTANNIDTLLGILPTDESVVIRVGVDDRSDGGLNGIDVSGSIVDLTDKVISVLDDGSTLKWTMWGSEAELNASSVGNYLNFIELKNINMASGTYFITKTSGSIVYNNINEENVTNDDLNNTVSGDLYLFVDRLPGNNWTKINVSLPTTGSITTQMLIDNAIHPNKIASNAVISSKILNGAVTTDKIANDSITAIKFKTGEITGTIFDDNAIDGAKISGNIATSKLVGAISGAIITDGTIITDKIADQQITSDKIVYMGISGDRLVDDAITTDKIADGAVTTNKIMDGIITSAKLAPGILDNGDLLADNIITEFKILGGSVTNGKLGPLSVSEAKIADGAITTTKIADGAVTLAKIAGSALSGKQDNIVAGSGITMDEGTNTISFNIGEGIGMGSILNSMIADGTITPGKLAPVESNSLGGDIVADSITSGGVAEGETFYAPEEIIGESNQQIGFGGYNGGYQQGHPRNSISMNDAGDLLVTTGNSKTLLIYKKTGLTWAVKQSTVITELFGLGDCAIMSHDGTTIAVMRKATNWHINNQGSSLSIGEHVYIYRDPTATWDSMPTQTLLSNVLYPTRFGLNCSLSTDGTKILITCVNPTEGTHLFVYNTDATSSTPIWSLNLDPDTFAGVEHITSASNRSWLTGDGNKILIRTVGTIGYDGALYVIAVDYTDNTYTLEYDYSTSTESVNGPASNAGNFIGASISRNGTRMFVPVKDSGTSPLNALLIYHYDSGSWVLNHTFEQDDIFSPDDYIHTNVAHMASRSEFVSDDSVGVLSGHYDNQGYTSRGFYKLDYVNGVWTVIPKISVGTPNTYMLAGFVYLPSKTYAYVESSLPDSNKGRITIGANTVIGVHSNAIKTNAIILNNGTVDLMPGTSNFFSESYSTNIVGNQVIDNGNMFISSNELNTVGSGATNIDTVKQFDKSPTLVLGHNTFGTNRSILQRPAIEFRTTQMTSLATHDWRMYSQGSTSVNSDLTFQSGRFVSNKNYRFDMIRFTGSQHSGSGGMISNYNTIAVEGDSTKRQSQCFEGLLILRPNSMRTTAGVQIMNGAAGYPSSGGYSSVGMELRTNGTSSGISSIWAHEDTTYFNQGDMSLMTKTDMNFYTGVQKFSNFGEIDQNEFKSMTIGSRGNVAIGTDIDTTNKLHVGGNLLVSGILTATGGFVKPLNIIETAPVVADTPVADLANNKDIDTGLGSSNGDKIFMSGDGTLVVMANVSLKTVYTFRLINNVWEDFATVSGDSNKYIYKNTAFFGKAIALSNDGLTLAVSDRTTVWIYKWNSGTSSWDEESNTCSDANYVTNTHSVGFCHNMKITNDGSKLLIISYVSASDYKLRIYDTATGNVLVNVTDNTDVLFSHSTQIDPGSAYSIYGYNSSVNSRSLQNWYRWKISMSGDGTAVAISGTDDGESFTLERTTLLFDIDYSNNTSSPNSVYDLATTGQAMTGRGLAFNNDGTLFSITIGKGNYSDNPRVRMYRRSLGTPSTWTMEKEYAPMPELEGQGSNYGFGDGFGEQITTNLDGSVVYIAAYTIEHFHILQLPKQHFVGRVSYNGSDWDDMSTISGVTETYWGVGVVCDEVGDTLSVANLKDGSDATNGGGFSSYDITINNLKFNSPGELYLSGGGSTNNHLTIGTSGNVGFGILPVPNVKLNVEGNISATGTITSSSDDRLKENELLIGDAISTIQKLRPEIYDKKPTFINNTQSEWIKESGLIAQEVWYSTPELRHLINLGFNIETQNTIEKLDTYETETHYIIKHILDDSGNQMDYNDIFVLDASGGINIDSSGNYEIDLNKFLLLDNSGVVVQHNGTDVLDYNKLKSKFIEGLAFKQIISEEEIDSNGNLVYDNSGNVQFVDVERDVLDDNGSTWVNSSEKLTFSSAPIVVKQKHVKKNHTKVVQKQIHTPINTEDIQDYTPNDDIENDPDYKALGWGDTPSTLNYIGLIPYLIKAMQEQQDVITQLKADVDALKNA